MSFFWRTWVGKIRKKRWFNVLSNRYRWMGVGRLWALFFLLSGCLLFAPSSDAQLVGPSGSESQGALSLLSQAGQNALLERALGSASVQALIQKLEARGLQRKSGAEQALAFERGQILILRFTPGAQRDFPPPPESKEAAKREPPKLERDVKRQPKRDPEPSPLAFLVYAALPQGEEAFAVLQEDKNVYLNLYPDGEKRFLLVTGDRLLEQLRKNERFRRFEADLKQRVEQVTCGPAFVDQATHTAYIFAHGRASSLSTASSLYGPAVYPPPSSYHLVEGATYLMLAKVQSLTPELMIDPESLWLFPHALKADAEEKRRPSEAGLTEACRVAVLAGGRRSSAWSGLRSFGWVEMIYPVELARSEPMSHMSTEPLPYTNLTIFCWELMDYPEDNILLRFKTDLELTLVLYNRVMKSADYGDVGVADGNSSLLLLAGYNELTPTEVYTVQQKINLFGPPSVTFEILQKLMEDVLGLSLEEVGLIFLRLAEAERQGRFAEEYAAVAHTKLARLRALLFKSPDYFPAHLSIEVSLLSPEAKESRAREFIRAAALEYARIIRELKPQGLEPQVFPPAIVGDVKWLGKLIVEIIINYAIEKVFDKYVVSLFVQEPFDDVIVFELLQNYEFYAVALLERQRFESHLGTYIDYGGVLPAGTVSAFNSIVSEFFSVEKTKKVYLAMLIALMHHAGKELDPLGDMEEFKKRMYTALQTILYLNSAVRLQHEKPGWKPREAWVPLGLYIKEEDGTPTVLLKQNVTVRNDHTGKYEERVNFAAVRIHDTPHFNATRCSEWLREAEEILYEATLRTYKNEKRWIKHQVAAVIFMEQPDPIRIRDLANLLYKESPLGGPYQRGYVIWREGDKVVYSRVDRGSRHDKETDQKIVCELIPQSWTRLPLEEYPPEGTPSDAAILVACRRLCRV